MCFALTLIFLQTNDTGLQVLIGRRRQLCHDCHWVICTLISEMWKSIEFMKYGRKHPKVLRSLCPPLTTWTVSRLSLSHLFTGEYMLRASAAWKINWFLNYYGPESLTEGWLDLGSPILKPPELLLGKGALWDSRGKLPSPVWSAFPLCLCLSIPTAPGEATMSTPSVIF